MVTIYDIAKETGYSPTTVSKAFNNYKDVSRKTREKILSTAKEMGYLPNSHARTLMTKRSWTIGVLFKESSGAGIRHPFFNAVIDSFKLKAEAEGYDLMFISENIGGKSSSYLEHCMFRSVDGVVIINADRMDTGLQELLDSEIPCVLLDYSSSKEQTLCSDNTQGSLLAVQYLFDLGHRRIAHISGGPGTFAGEQRQKGFEEALKKLSIPQKENYIAVSNGYFSIESGFAAMNTLLDLPEPPTAVLAAGDYLAIGAMQAVTSRGLSVPKDMSIIGFDDIEAAEWVHPKLSTVKQNVKLLGFRAAELLIESIETSSHPQTVVLPVELVIRESCCAI